MSKFYQILKLLAVIILFFFGGIVGIAFFFADYGPGETQLTRLVVAGIYFFIIGGVIGALSFPSWKRSGLVAWAVVIAAGLNIPQMLKEGVQRWIENGGMLIVPLVCALLGGFVVMKIRLKLNQKMLMKGGE